MALETEADRQAELEALGELVTGHLGTFLAIPLEAYEDSPIEGTVVEHSEASFVASAADVVAQGLVQGSTLSYGGESYRVTRLEPDRTGMTVVRCEVD